jgi:hypothetical protein
VAASQLSQLVSRRRCSGDIAVLPRPVLPTIRREYHRIATEVSYDFPNKPVRFAQVA